jgi:hypothetical protein
MIFHIFSYFFWKSDFFRFFLIFSIFFWKYDILI